MPAERDYPDHVRLLTLLWRGEESPSSRSGLTVGRIVTAAVELADRHGLAAVSMRKVAERLGVGAMSLYTYVPGREELTALMVDEVHGELATTGTPAGKTWREQLSAVAHDRWAMYLRHPWLLDVPVTRPAVGPNVADRYEYELRAIDGIGLDEHQMNAAIQVLGTHVAGTAHTMLEAAHDAERSGMTDSEWWARVSPVLTEVMAGRDYPISTRVGEAVGAPHTDPTYLLGFGLRVLLDGIEAQLPR